MIWVNVVQAQGRLMVISGCKRLRPGEEPLTPAEAVRQAALLAQSLRNAAKNQQGKQQWSKYRP